MAAHTSLNCRNLVIYEVFVRNHGAHGSFADIEEDLERIRNLGVDVIWFMPIHPIGEMRRKGTLGSPYSVRDFRNVNPEYGKMADFCRLIRRAQDLNLRVMLDMVFNHTSFDSDLVRNHIDWFHRGIDGEPYKATEGWTDVAGLKHPNNELATYLIDTLKYWADLGVGGFRCDVASLLPKWFWLEARNQLGIHHPHLLWLAESVTAEFVAKQRAAGRHALSDAELYEAFDLTYDYDIWPIWQAAVVREVPVARYLEMLRFQDSIYPANYAKLRCIEHHDSPRIMALAPSRRQALAWTAFQAFNKGALLIYAGQEAGATLKPSLFEIDTIQWGSYELAPFLTKLASLKKDPAQIWGQFIVVSAERAIQAAWQNGDHSLYGVFNVYAEEGEVDVSLQDGSYEDLLSSTIVEVIAGRVTLPESAFILRLGGCKPLKPFYSDLIDFKVKPPIPKI